MDRRNFLKTLGVAGAATLPGTKARAGSSVSDKEFVGILVDTTRCVGCQECEIACAEANGLPEPDTDSDLTGNRKTTITQYSAINYYETDVGEVYVKKQCMHCNQPACATACPSGACELKNFRTDQIVWMVDAIT